MKIPAGMGEFSLLFLKAARKASIDFEIVAKPSLFFLKKGRKKALFYGIRTPLNSLSASMVADDKYLTKQIWKREGIPVPRDLIFSAADFKTGIRKTKIVFPVVAKPMADSLKGKGIRTDIKSKKDLLSIAAAHFKKSHTKLLVEEYYGKLEDFRVMVLKGEVVGVLRRIRPYVVGDGIKNIKELIADKNARRHSLGKAEIKIDDELKAKLKSARLSLWSVPEKKRWVELKNVCNAAQGGEVEEMTDQICPANIKLCAKAAQAVGLDFAGLDILCTDISRPILRQRSVFLEINKQPDIALHHFPEFGKPNPVANKIVRVCLK